MVSMTQPTSHSEWRGDYLPDADQRIVLYGLDWDAFETLLALRGDRPSPRMAYLDGVVELMGPSRGHEHIKSSLGCLLEQYCLERGIPFTIYGSWLLKKKAKQAGVEPDECYVFGRDPEAKKRPDLAIEVQWTSGGIRKLEIYRRLGVPEVWFWARDAITIHELVGRQYVVRPESQFVPGVDLALLCELAVITPTSDAILALRERLKAR